jgi:hypothetical protein
MRFRDDRDEDDDDAWDDDSEADADLRDDDDDPTVPCPFCRRDILEDTPRGPYCERYLSPDDFARRSKPLWVLITAAVCLAIAIWLAFAI